MRVSSVQDDNLHISCNEVKQDRRYSPSNLDRICVPVHNSADHPGCSHRDVAHHKEDYNNVNDASGRCASV